MNRFLILLLGALLAAGCSSGGSSSSTVARADGTYEVGEDIAPGVYTAAAACLGTTASDAGYLIDGTGQGEFLGASARVGDRQRVVLAAGQFFLSAQCPEGWTQEGDTGPVVPDPATVVGACAILVDNRLVDEALSIARNPAEYGSARSTEVQEELFAIVTAGNRRLLESAGQLVDLLDDPAGYGEPSGFTTKVDRAVAKIRQVCART